MPAATSTPTTPPTIPVADTPPAPAGRVPSHDASTRSRGEHWESVYRSRGDTELSWYQAEPGRSLELVRSLPVPPRRAIDVGGGQSALSGALLEAGVEDVTVLDIAPAALDRGRERLGAAAARVRWIAGDVLDPTTLADADPVDLWHDRAVLHFLTDADERRRYVEAAARLVVPGGHAVIATFAPDGPERCSGLPVHRSDGDALAADFASAFRLIHAERETHLTPWGAPQAFTYVVLERRRA